MLQHIKELELAGDQAQLRHLAETLPQGDALARAYIALSKLAEDRSTTGADYREALRLAQRAIAAADHGGLMWTWAQGRVATMAADLGNYRLAERAAGAYLDALPYNSGAQALAPWAHYALGRVLAHQENFAEAVTQYRMALDAGAPPAFAERVELAMVWALAQDGKPTAAAEACPGAVHHVSDALLHAAHAVVLAWSGDWQGARTAARSALPYYAGDGFLPCDVVEAAELLLILKRAAEHLGMWDVQAVRFEHRAASFGGWTDDLLNGLLPTLPREGGVWIAAASLSRGLPAGYHRCGVRGVCG